MPLAGAARPRRPRRRRSAGDQPLVATGGAVHEMRSFHSSTMSVQKGMWGRARQEQWLPETCW